MAFQITGSLRVCQARNFIVNLGGTLWQTPNTWRKKAVKRLYFLLGLILCGSLAFGSDHFEPVKPESVGLSAQRLARMDSLINSHIDEKKIAGAVVLIARKGKIAYFRASGLADTDKPMQKDTIFRIASMPKPLTCAAIMLLYEEGRLLLSDRISKYIPEFRSPKVLELQAKGSDPEFKLVPAKREITIRDLLSHTSGIVYLFDDEWYPGRKLDLVTDFYKEAGIGDGLCRPDETVGVRWPPPFGERTSCKTVSSGSKTPSAGPS